jgi:hypothetical protein
MSHYKDKRDLPPELQQESELEERKIPSGSQPGQNIGRRCFQLKHTDDGA